MPGIAQLYPALVVHNRSPGAHPIGKLCLGEDHIQLNQHLNIQTDVFGVARRLGGQFGQDSLDLLLLFQLQLPQGIVGVDGRQGLYKVGRPRGGHVVDHAGHIVFALGLDGDHIPALPDGDDGLPQKFGIGRGRDHLLQAVPDFPGLDAHMAADIRQRGGGCVGNLLFRENGTENLVL